MANTVTTTTLSRTPHKVVLYVTVLSDGSNETGTVIYDSSAQAALIKDPISGAALADPLHCRILSMYSSFSSVVGTAQLLFDATTDVLALPIPPSNQEYADFRYCGGLPDYAGTGITGDILLTTKTLAAGDSIAFILEVVPA